MMTAKSSISFPGAIAPTVDIELTQLGIYYDVIAHPETTSLSKAAGLLGVSRHMIARAVMMREGDYICMVVLPMSHIIDFSELKVLTQRDLQPMSVHAVSDMFPDCQLDSIPPFGGLYNIETIYDTSLLVLPSVIFRAGTHHTLIRLNRREFEKLLDINLRGSFSSATEILRIQSYEGLESVSTLDFATRFRNFTPTIGLESAAEDKEKIAIKPDLVARLIELQKRSDPNNKELELLLENNDFLASQFKQLLSSSILSGQSQSQIQQDAVAIVLSLAILNNFKFYASGVMGLAALWHQALMSISLLLQINETLAQERRLSPSLLWLGGCLHNSGFFLYGCLMHSKYHLFNKLVESNPDVSMIDFESLFVNSVNDNGTGLKHAGIAASLMSEWGLPSEVVIAIREHHNDSYVGDYCDYANLLLISDRLLKGIDIGDAESSELPAEMLEKLALNSAELVQIRDKVAARIGDLDPLVSYLTQ